MSQKKLQSTDGVVVNEFSGVTVVGGGLSGSEAAWQLAQRGHRVKLLEMRPEATTRAHKTAFLGELVCSNSLKSVNLNNASGILKKEMEVGGSLILQAAVATQVAAGSALAVDRDAMGEWVTQKVESHPLIELERTLVKELPSPPAIIATGPLTEGPFADRLAEATGTPLYFYDAIAPIVDTETVDTERSFVASRWAWRDTESASESGLRGDYINCPLNQEEYEEFVAELLQAEKVPPREFEEPRYFEGCLPIEIMAARGMDVLRHGPMRPVGLKDPKTGRRPYAVLQLRAENRHGSAHNLVGFQTRLKYGEQKRVFSKIPALRNARFLRLGSIHRNTYLRAPRCLDEGFVLKGSPGVRVTGLLSGVEGYVESVAMGWLTGVLTAATLAGDTLCPPPLTTATGSLYAYLRRPLMDDQPFTPTNMNMSLLPPADTKGKKASKKERRLMVGKRAVSDFTQWVEQKAR